ncbi:hypothetical protein NQU49_26280, partial [Escherichia coli]|uniref:hypothetical protein n=1 Tax=Escherichia coli TaxID=562 RepID=UPI002118EE66
ATASSLTVEAVDVSGRTFGIQASNAGSGATIVTATGMVAATNGTGLLANHMGGPAGLMIGVASVSGGTNGIDARNTGGGGTRVTVAGD